MLQNARFTAFTASELLRENQQVGGRGKITIPHNHPDYGKLLFCKPPYGLAPYSKPNLTGLSITSKMCLTPIFLGGGHYDDSIGFWEEILYGRLQKSILQPLIFSFRG